MPGCGYRAPTAAAGLVGSGRSAPPEPPRLNTASSGAGPAPAGSGTERAGGHGPAGRMHRGREGAQTLENRPLLNAGMLGGTLPGRGALAGVPRGKKDAGVVPREEDALWGARGTHDPGKGKLGTG